ncbi:MAG: endonuclease/exonuclease/phosphatase family protein [Clostridia bacterium]|nr:endonuclease/exonuclease/phosphatase family protein [Clostridia bacterium]
MFTILLKRGIVFLMSLISLFTGPGGKNPGDSYAAHEFPLISAEQQAPGTVRVMSFNIRCADVNGVDVPDRLDIGARQILEVMPDSLGIQEATAEWMKALKTRLFMYGWTGIEREKGEPADKSGESCPIFYLKAKFRLLDSGNFWLSETPDEPSFGSGAACRRICTWAKLQDRETEKVYVHINTHFDHVSEDARVFAAGMVNRFVKKNFADIPVVFTADINTFEGLEAYSVLTENLADSCKTAQNSVPFGTFHACSPETHSDYTIDFLLCSKDITVKTYRTVTIGVDGRFVSDHFPIYADILLP